MNSSFYTKGICGNGMVLQRNSVNCVYGVAPKSSIVEFSFRNLKWKTEADENGNWKFEFNPGKEGGPRDSYLHASIWLYKRKTQSVA